MTKPASQARWAVKQAVPFFRVSNEASLRFYVDGLGFEMTQKWVDEGKFRWCWLQLGGAAVMLQEFPREGTDSWVPGGTVGEGVSVCLMCDDAVAICRDVTARGLRPVRPYVGNRLWVVSLSDPDGYRLDFESPTDLPEDAQYAEPGR